MSDEGLLALARLIQPSEILSNFEVVGVEEDSSLIRIYLDESVKAEYTEGLEIESKGFCDAVAIRDFPIRDKGVMVREITMDMSNSMRLIAKRCFPNAMRTIDSFHIQKLACDALQEMRIAHRWDAIRAGTDSREEAGRQGEAYAPLVLANGDTHKQLLARSRYLLFKSADKWTESQRRAEVLFETYLDLKEAYSLTHSLKMIFSKNTIKDAARLSLVRWYNKVGFLCDAVTFL